MNGLMRIVLAASLAIHGLSIAQTPITPNTVRLDDPTASPEASLEDVSWLVGDWVGDGFGSRFEEVWNPASAGTMVGMFKLFDAAEISFYELMLLAEEGGSLSLKVKHFAADFSAREDAADYVEFPLVAIEADAAHFSGLSFRRIGDDALEAFIAVRRDGEAHEERLSYRRRVPDERVSAADRLPAVGRTELNLVGNRFRPLQFDELTPAQIELLDSVLAGPRTAFTGPFNVLLRSPEMGDLAQKLGAYIRFNSSLPAPLREMAIIMTARYWSAEYEWYAHKRAALAAGLDPSIVTAIANRRRPASMTAEQAALYEFCNEMLSDHEVGDATFANAIATLGEQQVVDAVGTMGYYSLVAMVLNADEHPIPAGVEPELN